MNIVNTTTGMTGLIEYRGRTIAVRIPDVNFLTMDTKSYAIARVEALRLEALDPDYTTDERSTLTARADFLVRWIDSGCPGTVPFSVDVALFARSTFEPSVVMHHAINTYLDQIVNVSTIIPIEEVDAPQFAFRNNDGEAQLWLTENRNLRNARLYPGPDVQIVETNTHDLNAIITSQQTPQLRTAAVISA